MDLRFRHTCPEDFDTFWIILDPFSHPHVTFGVTVLSRMASNTQVCNYLEYVTYLKKNFYEGDAMPSHILKVLEHKHE